MRSAREIIEDRGSHELDPEECFGAGAVHQAGCPRGWHRSIEETPLALETVSSGYE